MSKKLISIALALTMALVLFAGCGGSGGEDKIELDPSKSYISVATWDGGLGSQWLKDAAKLFEEMHKETVFEEGKVGVQVEIIASRNFDGSAMAYTPLNHDIYFVEAVEYHAMVDNGQLTDITDVVTGALSDYGEEGSIYDKMDPTLQTALDIEGKYYAIPFYETFYSFAYDLDLWDEKSFYISANGGWTDASGDLAAGPDGVAGTSDDGLPATFADFDKLITRIKDAGAIPFVLPENALDYIANLMYEYWANLEGAEQMLLNYTFDGVATDLISVSEDGTVTQLPEVEITIDNGYELQKQAGKYQTLKFLQDVLLSAENNYKTYDTHLNTQKVFVRSGVVGDEPVAMIVEGSWWENEAKAALEKLEEDGYERHNYAVMPMPFASEEQVGQKATWLAMSNSYGFVPAASDNVAVAKEFMKFLHTDERLSAFTGETNMTRALNYEISQEDAAKISTYAKSILELKENSDVIFPISTLPEVLASPNVFGAYSWAWKNKVNGLEYKHAWLYYNEEKDPSAEEYFNALIEQAEYMWPGIV